MKGLKGVLSRTKSSNNSDNKKGRGNASVSPSGAPNDIVKASGQQQPTHSNTSNGQSESSGDSAAVLSQNASGSTFNLHNLHSKNNNPDHFN
ncbi:hypothetical protein BX616_006440, partial [Lobosporangium transversale]